MITTFSLPLTEVPTCYYFFKTLSRKFSASILSTSRAPGALHSIALSKFSRNNHGSKSFPTGTEKFKRSNQPPTSPRDDEIPCQSLYRRSTHPVLVNYTYKLLTRFRMSTSYLTASLQKKVKNTKMTLPAVKKIEQNRFSGTEQTCGEINWRLPTLAEPIEPLPLARVCLTAEFGMGSGRATPLWPPKIGCQKIGCRGR